MGGFVGRARGHFRGRVAAGRVEAGGNEGLSREPARMGRGRSPRIGSDGEGGSGRSSAPGSVVVGEGLIEGIAVGAGWCSALGFSFPLGCLVEIDLGLWRSACGSESWGPMGEGEVSEDALDDRGVGEEGEDAQGAVASGATQGVELVDAGQELGPAEAVGAGGARRAVVGW